MRARWQQKGMRVLFTISRRMRVGKWKMLRGLMEIQPVHFFIIGDAVTIDTSYCSVTYGFLLGVWLGIDNHGRPIFFGCTVLQDDTSKSFSWALQVFVGFMKGRQPEIVVTDMESDLRDALAI